LICDPLGKRNAIPKVFIGPSVSGARTWKMWKDSGDEYFDDFL